MQRLFSSFPWGWPGAGLLLLRANAAIPLLSYAWSSLSLSTPLGSPAMALLAVVLSGLIGLGFCTPYAALGQVLIELSMAIQGDTFINAHTSLVGVGISLMLIGPGACSIDAKLFGRKRIDLNGNRDGTA